MRGWMASDGREVFLFSFALIFPSLFLFFFFFGFPLRDMLGFFQPVVSGTAETSHRPSSAVEVVGRTQVPGDVLDIHVQMAALALYVRLLR